MSYRRYCRAVAGEPLPLALIDLDAVEENARTLLAPLAGSDKTLRLATKSIRCIALLRHLIELDPEKMRGLLAFSPAEAAFLVGHGFRDVLVAYPTAQPSGARHVAEANARGASVAIVADDDHQLELLAQAAARAGCTIPVVVDVDLSYQPLGQRLRVGVRRSPLREPEAIASFAERIATRAGLSFGGVLGYEAHIAGVSDEPPVKRALKALAAEPVLALRRAIVAELERHGLPPPLFNGGGSGSMSFSAGDAALSELSAGSGFLDSHLFDHYRDLSLVPAVFYALEVTRRPGPGYVTCQGGGFIASGAAGADRLPRPALPEGLALTALEGAGEVQTPLSLSAGVELQLGAPVFFRHAKAGELAEHFNEYLLVRGERIERRAPTYRGEGQCFA